MLRTLALAVALLPCSIAATPASAVTSEEKMETCKVGAESQQLQGAKRDAFIKKCMAGGNYEPRREKECQGCTETPVTHADQAARTAGRSSGVTSNRRRLPRRRTSMAIARPIRSPLSNRIRSSTPVTEHPSARTIVSRLISPARAAGPFDSRAVIIAPDEFSISATRA